MRGAAWLALLVLSVFASGSVFGTLHRAFVRHVVCEHGDLVEVEHHGASFESVARGVEAGGRGLAQLSAGSVLDEHDHAHCFVGVVARSLATFAGCVMLACMLSSREGARARARDLLSPRSLLLFFAPKTSPPAPAV